MSKKYAERKDTIKSVRLVIDAYDGRDEYPWRFRTKKLKKFL